MVFAQDIRETILKLADEKGPEKGFMPSDVAKRIDHDNWQGLMDQIWFVADVLVKEGKIKTNGNGDSVHLMKSSKN